MKLFDAVPSELFSVLASPNRVLYSDALDVLYDAYRENLKIPENKLYTMLRSTLEQQLADASFDGEDIDEEELKDISLRFRGSSNQRLIDVKASLKAGETILWDDKQKGMRENNDIHSC